MDIMPFLDLAWEAFSSWLWLFGAPAKDFNVLWIIIPIWLSWFFTEFFQEKHGTKFGNAITNGAIPIWVGIDWIRNLTEGIAAGTVETNYTLFVKFGVAALALVFGLVVIIEGLKRKEFAHIGGSIRVITYILVMFTPIVYGTAEISLMTISVIFIFFPVYYYFIELIVRIVPDSKAIETDEQEGHTESNHEPLPGLPDTTTAHQAPYIPSSDHQEDTSLPGLPPEAQTPDFSNLPGPKQGTRKRYL
jgi:hypothetical protein